MPEPSGVPYWVASGGRLQLQLRRNLELGLSRAARRRRAAGAATLTRVLPHRLAIADYHSRDPRRSQRQRSWTNIRTPLTTLNAVEPHAAAINDQSQDTGVGAHALIAQDTAIPAATTTTQG